MRQDSHNLEELLRDMHEDMLAVVGSADDAQHPQPELPQAMLRVAAYLSEFEEQSRERSTNIATLSHLAGTWALTQSR